MKLSFNTLAVLLAAGSVSYAQNPASGGAAPARQAATPATSISAITQGLKKYEGFFNFYYDEKTGKVFLEVDKLDKEFLYFSSLTDGVGSGGPRRPSRNLLKLVRKYYWLNRFTVIGRSPKILTRRKRLKMRLPNR
jgi:hypothetical protein